MECYADRNAFVTLKDHKDNFQNNPKCRLLNPAKSEIGIVSKNILGRINSQVLKAIEVNQWRSTSTVVQWFKNIENKPDSKFIQFDIVDFYPSISEPLLKKALAWASTYVEITDKEMKIIMNARKSMLFNNHDVWIKKGENPLFDVTMGSYDGAEICELVGLYLLFESLAQLFGKENVGLYRDDGLAVVKNLSGSQTDRLRKRMVQCFKDNGLQITVDINLQVTNFLDVTLDLPGDKYYPYRKPNNELLYINSASNHPPSIIKQLPDMINRRISDISCNEVEFEKAKPDYEEALTRSGFSKSMKYESTPQTKKSRKRNIIWFNPPFSQNVKTNIGKKFMALLEKHFPSHHKFRKLFNKNTVKLSYSCMESVANVIRRHNASILNSDDKAEPRPCNCKKKQECPLDGKCREESIVYKAVVSSGGVDKKYYGICEGDFKLRYNNHTKSFRDVDYKSSTELSKYIWSLNGRPYTIKWSIAARSSPYRCGSRSCSLCLMEKLMILKDSDPDSLLNKRDELISKCRHRNKYCLKNLKT